MPNWCNTEYILQGKKENLQEIAEKINSTVMCPVKPEDRIYGTFQTVGRLFGKSIGDYDARSDIQQAELNTDSSGEIYLQTWTTTAWKPDHSLIDLLCEKFGLHYLYYTEEAGNCIYETNDRNGKFFPDRYIVEQCNKETSYYTTEKDALQDIAKRTGTNAVQPETVAGVIDAYNNRNKKNMITFIKIKVL
jgi:hypothetical protein